MSASKPASAVVTGERRKFDPGFGEMLAQVADVARRGIGERGGAAGEHGLGRPAHFRGRLW